MGDVRMLKKFGSIKVRIITIMIVFSIASTLTMVSFASYQFRQSARRNLLQSTEFNLNLIAGLVKEDLESLNNFRSWCSSDTSIAEFLSDPESTSVAASSAYERLAGQALAAHPYQHLLRVILISSDGQRILQAGTGTSAGIPVQEYSIYRLNSLEISDAANQWTGFTVDPFLQVNPSTVLATSSAVYLSKDFQRKAVGTAYLLVSTNMITDHIKDYQLPEGCNLYVTIQDQSYSLGSALSPVAHPQTVSATNETTLNSSTQISQCKGASGDGFLAVTCPVGSTGLYLTQTISNKAVSAQQKGLADFQVVVFCSSIAVMGLIVLFMLNRMISHPINELNARMDAISQGDFSPDPSIEWNNELGEIGRGINNLAKNVNSLMERRVSDEKARQALEYEVLLNQVNPHFLYNSLNSIKWMATIQHAPGIAEMTGCLARLLKTVSKGKHSLIPLSEEISLLDDYFVIQKYRYGGAITMEKDISPDTLGAYLPRFTLQPLLENAVFHGIEPKGGVGTIRLSSHRQGDDLIITLWDSGIGINQEQISALLSDSSEKSSGMFKEIGVSNIHNRIQSEFGEQYGLSFESEVGSFTCVTVHLPYTEQKNQEDIP